MGTPSRYMSNEKINYDGLIRVEKPLYSSNDEQSDSDLNSNSSSDLDSLSSEKYEQFNDENNHQNSSKSNHMQFTFRRREKNALEVNVVSTALPIEANLSSPSDLENGTEQNSLTKEKKEKKRKQSMELEEFEMLPIKK